MKAVWLEHGRLSLRDDLPIPEPTPSQALIKVLRAGICATDLEMVRGYYPFQGILGHEFVGQVVSAPGHADRVGQRVVGEINIACGACATCRRGYRTHCEHRKVLGIRGYHGAFAEYLLLPLENLHVVPPGLPDDVAVFCEPLAAAVEILEQVHIRPNERVCLIGAGRLGQLIARVLKLSGVNLGVVARYQSQVDLLNGLAVNILTESQVNDEHFDIVIEATGSPDGFDLARSAVCPKGTIILKSTFKAAMSIDISRIVVDEITVIGSRCGPFRPAIDLLTTGCLNPRSLISAHFPLQAALEAFQHAGQPGVLKVVLTMAAST
jgi:2-desacetyl-2-hydroxyethyl bacteriochlorophyllide A dehydrogenase